MDEKMDFDGETRSIDPHGRMDGWILMDGWIDIDIDLDESMDG
jgi:hypothetical protein